MLETLESISVAVAKAVRGVDIPRPFPRLTYAEAIDRYGTEDPTKPGIYIMTDTEVALPSLPASLEASVSVMM